MLWKRIARHRVSVQDLSILCCAAMVATYIAFEYDVYGHERTETVHEETIELNEALSLGALVTAGLFVFSIRRYIDQKRETRRRITAEQQARELVRFERVRIEQLRQTPRGRAIENLRLPQAILALDIARSEIQVIHVLGEHMGDAKRVARHRHTRTTRSRRVVRLLRTVAVVGIVGRCAARSGDR